MKIDPEQTPLLEVTGASTFQEYQEATQTWSMNSGRKRRIRYQLFVKHGYLTAATCVVIGVAGFYIGLLPAVLSQQGEIGTLLSFVIPLFAGLAGGGAVLLFNPMMYRRRLRRIFRQGHFDCAGTSKFYAEGLIAIRKDGSAQSSFDWEAFEHWAESDGVFVIMPSKVQYAWIPKRLLNTEQQNQLRELLTAKIPADKDNS